jgi:hypothetical protein
MANLKRTPIHVLAADSVRAICHLNRERPPAAEMIGVPCLENLRLRFEPPESPT